MQSYYVEPAPVDMQTTVVVDKEHVNPTRLVDSPAEPVHHPLLLLVFGLLETHQPNVLAREQDRLAPVERVPVVLGKGVHVPLGEVVQQTDASVRDGV